MVKRQELTDPRSCMSRAREDEMTFVLLGRDAAAPVAIRAWIAERIRLGKNQPGDPQIKEAEAVVATLLAGRAETSPAADGVYTHPTCPFMYCDFNYQAEPDGGCKAAGACRYR